jgi:predicted anti-sigma-YlaC factor YlaD
MHCDEIQHALATGSLAPEQRDDVSAHLETCSACRNARLDYALVDEVLSRSAVWEPPPGFAQSMAARGARLAQGRLQPARRRSNRFVGRFFGSFSTVEYIAASLVAAIGVRMAGPAWVLRQYWALVVNARI